MKKTEIENEECGITSLTFELFKDYAKINKRLIFALALSIGLLIITNLCWILFISQYYIGSETTSEITTTTNENGVINVSQSIN